MKSLIIGGVLLAAPLFASASQPTPYDPACNDATEIALSFVEHAITIKPELAFRPVRSFELTSSLQAVCIQGIEAGKARNPAKLKELFKIVRAYGKKKSVTPQEGIFMLGDMATALAYQAGYLEGIK